MFCKVLFDIYKKVDDIVNRVISGEKVELGMVTCSSCIISSPIAIILSRIYPEIIPFAININDKALVLNTSGVDDVNYEPYKAQFNEKSYANSLVTVKPHNTDYSFWR